MSKGRIDGDILQRGRPAGLLQNSDKRLEGSPDVHVIIAEYVVNVIPNKLDGH